MLIAEPFYNTKERYGYYSPTRIISHSGSRHRSIPIIASSRAYILVIDKTFADRPLEDLLGGLEECRQPYRTIVVKNEPSLSDVEQAVSNLNRDTDLVIALGGGSTIDFSKALSLMISGYSIPPDENAFIKIPIVLAIPTTCGTGSEASRHCVLYGRDKRKFAARHWGLSPALALLDPYFIKTASDSVIVGSAFDSFIHHLEVFTLNSESSGYSRHTSAYWMDTILNECSKGISSEFSEENILQLQIASSFGGIAISNHRTGLVHTCAESLASIIDMSHPATLHVFFEAILKSYATWLDDELKRLGIGRMTSSTIISSWNSMLRKVGIVVHREDSTSVDPSELVRLILRDTVIFKEYPVKLSEEMILRICKESLRRTG
jgi:alcohol dehydrogenase class IV